MGDAVFPSLGEDEPAVWYPGKVVWRDLFTANPDEAAGFYSQVFDWEPERLVFGKLEVLLMRSGGYPVACIVERKRVEGDTEGGLWVAYASIPSIDDALRRVSDAGGRVLVEKGILPGRGEHAICADPQGAIFGLIKSESGDPGEYFPNPNEFIWSQQFSSDSTDAAAFYGRASNFEIVEDDRFGDQPLFILSSGGFARAGISQIPEQGEDDRADWIQFIRVDSLSKTLERVYAADGKIVMAPRESLLDGKVAIIADTGGALIGLWEADPPTTSPSDAKEVAQ